MLNDEIIKNQLKWGQKNRGEKESVKKSKKM